ncbi:type II toxin-antitoxin system RelE/ParE family toxin [Aureibaculum sp. 2210JD6-5]|uniref:type II toxin-antitoxin system RelE/ParE family toxin n=1 Tax=Aureibaculum sp. 2210JD6-5 TaxID=3103957 RepID=UPI002AAC5756|nr:type II toxin-antitoxin system RelE/ParE family toxin [Aureibaculum sp. 2210JD6-5]MDY7394052.1 type II toxin-antitoxin system RelE/ParE family toxin [Aureibaculum sp. 2210JD6-5]
MEIIWTSEAKKTFKQNVNYLKKEWPLKVVEGFVDSAYDAISKIQVHPKIGRYDKVWDCYKLIVVKQITLYYQIDKNKIVLISFWNNYQKPKE